MGIADILITRLSNIRELNVRPTSAIMIFDNFNEDSISAGRKLNVDAVLEGTVFRVRDRVRITARLMNVGNQSAIWATEFEKAAGDELPAQNEIALQLVDALALNLASKDFSRSAWGDQRPQMLITLARGSVPLVAIKSRPSKISSRRFAKGPSCWPSSKLIPFSTDCGRSRVIRQ